MTNLMNPVPLEKQLLHLNLSKGINERDRPETAESATCLTQVNNLLQDQTGGYVKRPGFINLGTLVDATVPKKVFALSGGLGSVNASGDFFQYQESGSQSFVKRGRLGRLSVSAAPVSSSGSSGVAVANGFAASSNFHVVITDGWMEVYDRNAHACVARYNLMRMFGLVQSGVSNESYACAFTSDRYLHVYMTGTDGTGGRVRSTVIDTANPLPLGTGPFASISNLNMVKTVAGEIYLLDIEVDNSGNSYLLVGEECAAYPCFVVKMDSSVAATITAVRAQTRAIAFANDATVYLWYVTDARIGYYDSTTMVEAATALFAFTSLTTITANSGNWKCGLMVDSSGRAYVTYEYDHTLDTGKTCIGVKMWRTNSALSLSPTQYATILGWRMQSHPFQYTSGAGVGYGLTLLKQLAAYTTQASCHVVCSIDKDDCSTLIPGTWATALAATAYNSLPVLATVEPNLAIHNTWGSYGRTNRVWNTNSSQYYVMCATLATARGFSFNAVSLDADDHTSRQCELMGGSNYISGGTHMTFCGGKVPNECGFVDFPTVTGLSVVGAGALATGTYKYLAIFRHTDDYGNVTYSRCSEIQSVSVVLGASLSRIKATPPYITNKDDGVVVAPTTKSISGCTVDLYRTTSGGTQYYLCASSSNNNGTSAAVMSLTGSVYSLSADAMSDATLITQPSLHRQPGTPNTAVDRYPPPGGAHLIQHRDRLFTTDPLGVRVYYSSFFVDGECAWYNPAFSFFVHGGSGPITGLASMDGRLFVFKRNAIFVVDGDGPAEAGVTGNEFSPPQRLATEFGCVDFRSIQMTSDGIIYRSTRGVEMLTRSLQVKWIGDRVFKTLDAYPDCHGSSMDDGGRYHLLVSTSAGTSAVHHLVYDTTLDAWTTFTTDIYGHTDVCFADLKNRGQTLCYASPTGYIMRLCTADDNYYVGVYETYVSWTIETGWMKVGQQARARFSKILGLLKAHPGAESDNNHKVTFRVAFNYVDTYTQTATWEPGTLNTLEIEELEIQLNRPEVMAVRFKMEDAAPTDTGTYPIGSGQGPDVLGITVEIAVKSGAPKGPAGHKA